MASRRSFIRSTAALLSAAGWLHQRSGLLGFVTGLDKSRLGGGLFFDGEAVDRFRGLYQSDRYASLRTRIESVDQAVERRFLKSEIRYNDQLYDIARVSDRATDMAFHFLMTGDEDAASLAVEYMDALMKFGRWDYFLEDGDKVFGLQRAPGATVAVSLCWDWLDGFADEAARNEWVRIMGERGCEPSWLALYGMRFPDRVVGWTMDETSTYFEHRPNDRVDLSNWPHILNRTNLKAVPASALAIGSVAYARAFGEDERVAKWVEQSIYSIRTFRDLYAVDGSYDEGVSYANYTSSNIAQATVALERYNGVSLYDEINWAGYVDYLIGMSMATESNPAQIVNFGDASGAATAAVPYWVAGRTGDRRSRWYGDALSQERDMWSLLWDPDAVEPASGKQGLSVWHSALDLVVARTGYRAEDLVVAMRSGGPSNHEHADRNSIVVKWGGEVLIVDPSRPPYSYADPSWMMRTTAGHSALLIDGKGHQYHDGRQGTNASDAVAKIIRFGERDGYVYWTSDATPAYKLVDDDIESVTRTVFVFEELESALVLDKVRKRSQPSVIEARFFGDNRKSVDGHFSTQSGGEKPLVAPSGGCTIDVSDRSEKHALVTADIRRPLAAAHIASTSVSGLDVSVGKLPIPEEHAVLHPFARIATEESTLAPMITTVVVPYVGERIPDVRFDVGPFGATDVYVSRGITRLRCRVVDSGDVPEVTVLEW